MEITKSSRHSKITGDFAEQLILYWLSKSGFECALVDHVGLDIIARKPRSKEVMGISVKARSRTAGTERTALYISNDNFEKLDTTCKAFACSPYFALVIDAADSISAFILSKPHLLKLCPPGKLVASWGMNQRLIERYAADPKIWSFRLNATTGNWLQT